MSYCLNPRCPSPQHPSDLLNYCPTCGTSLLLRGHYRAMRPLGQGGMGRTFLAVDEDTPSKRKCVIKQFSPAPDILNNPTAFEKSLELFKREAETLDRLGDQSHQIPHLLAYLEREQQFYLVQEFIDGENLLQHLSHQDGYSEAEVRQVLDSLLPVLDFVHRQGVIHRDIKPENIMRCQNGRLVLIDFGISKQLDQTMVRPGTRGGTQGYAPPEQLVYGVAYPASDLYALGTTCLHLLTKTPPHDLFDHYKKQWTWRSVLQAQGKTISPSLGAVLDKLLQEDHKQRYPSAVAVMDALKPQPETQPRSPIPDTVAAGSHPAPGSDGVLKIPVAQPIPQSEAAARPFLQKIAIGLLIGAVGVGIFQVSQISNSRSTVPDVEARDPIGSPSPLPGSGSVVTAAALVERGDQLREAERWTEAIEAYTQAIELEPDNTLAYHNRGLSYYGQGDWQAAVADYTRTIELEPDDVDAHYNRGLAHYNQGELQAALVDYNRAIELDPTYSFAFNNRGNVYYDQGNLQAALADYNRAIEADRNNAIAYYNRGNVHYDQSNLQAALADYNRAIELDPTYAFALNNRGNVYYDQGNLQAALVDYNRAIELNPGYIFAYISRGNVYFDQNNLQLASADYSKAIELDPDYALAYYNRGNVHRNQSSLPAALADYGKAIELDPNYADAYYNRGLTLEQSNQIQNAILDFQRAAVLYQQQGNSQFAQEALNEVLRLQQQ